jgi:membrane protease YdiL (CAAX protease family)
MRWLLVPLAPVVLTILVLTAIFTASGGEDPGLPAQAAVLLYGLANVVVLLALRWRAPGVWRASARFDAPSGRELTAAVIATVVGVVLLWPLTTILSEAVGVTRYTVPTVSTPFGVVALFVGSVVVAPVAEEILYRGLLFGTLLERGQGPLLAGLGSLVVFAAIHVFTAGVGGVINAVLLGALLTWLRLRFDSLVGAWLLHVLNNLLEFLIALSILPSLYAL